jgi:hypothetical protein
METVETDTPARMATSFIVDIRSTSFYMSKENKNFFIPGRSNIYKYKN